MVYEFKGLQELLWVVLQAVALVVLGALAQLDPGVVADWRAWAVALAAACVRAAAGAALDWMGRRQRATDSE